MAAGDRQERKVELAELRGARAEKHQWKTHHNAAQQRAPSLRHRNPIFRAQSR